MNQLHLWLAPLVIGSVFGIVTCLRVSIRWSYGYLLQHVLIAATALAGWLFASWICALAGWALFLVFNIGRRSLISEVGIHLGALRTEAALKKASMIRLLSWGPPGSFWIDLIKIMDCYAKQDVSQAEQIAARWDSFPLPWQMRDTLASYTLTGMIMMRDWQKVVEAYEQFDKERKADSARGKRATRSIAPAAISASRAFLECGRYADAVKCLENADIPDNYHQRDSLDLVFVSFYSLSGASDKLHELLRHIKGACMPEYAKAFWSARCAAVNGNFQLALQEFDRCLQLTPPGDLMWRERVLFQRQRAQLAAEAVRKADDDGQTDQSASENERRRAIEQGAKIYDHALLVSQIMDNGRRDPVIKALVFILSSIFALGLAAQLSGDEQLSGLYLTIFSSGMLSDAALHGQYWRFLTYLFLHANLSHLVMNLFGLVWLGKHVVNAYGAVRFSLIFWGAGVLSGITQVVLSPGEPAVGASGAVMGIFGASAAATLRLKHILPPRLRKSELTWMSGLAVMQLVFDQVVNFAFTLQEGQESVRIAAWAHGGGMVAGFLLGYCLPLRSFLRAPRQAKEKAD